MKTVYHIPPGEFFAADKIRRYFKKEKPEIYFPLKDMGVDLLVIFSNQKKPVRVQVKESRAYSVKDHSWHQVRAKKIKDADVFVFVNYVPVSRRRKTEFVERYLVVPSRILQKLCRKHKKLTRKTYHFYFGFADANSACDYRESKETPVDYSPYRDAWHYIKKA